MRQKVKSILGGISLYYWLFGLLVIAGLYLTSLYDYLLFHSFVELFSIIVAVLIFTITWNTRDKIENNYLLLAGTAFLFIGGIDLVHTLAYPGMGIFSGRGANLSTQLWISARYVEAFTLLIAPLLFYRETTIDVSYPMIAYETGFILIMVSIFGGFFPTCYIEGVGLTPFKIISEYIISIVLAFSLYFLYRYRDRFKSYVFRLLAVSIILTIGSEIAFTFYISVYGFSNLVGHFLKLLSFFLIYQALIATGLKEPFDLLYRELKEKEERLVESKKRAEREKSRAQNFLDIAGSIIVVLNREGKVTLINKMGRDIIGRTKGEIVGKDWFDNFVPEENRKELKKIHEKIMSEGIEKTKVFENPILTKDGEERIISWKNTGLRDDEGNIVGTLSSGMDITERRKAEKRFKDLFEASPDPIYLLDEDGTFQEINEAAVETLGYEKKEVIGKHILDVPFFPPETKQKILEKFKERRNEEEFSPYRIKAETKSGEQRYAEINATLIEEKREIVGTMGIARDVTELHKSEERQEFLQTLLRQDLRSKYQTMEGFIQILQEETDLSEEHGEYLRKAIEAGREADEILDLAKKLGEIEESEWTAEKDIVKVLKHVTGDISRLVEKEGVELEENYPVKRLKAESDYSLNTLLSQILTTRIRLSKCDKIKINVEEKGEEILLKIEDDGNRLSKDIKELFSGEAYTGKTTGIGGVRYYMLKEIAEHNDFRIRVKDSDLGGVLIEIWIDQI